MIWHPKRGQRVVVRYKKPAAPFGSFALDGCSGTVEKVGHGPGPHNVVVHYDNGVRMVVPRGNLFREKVEVKA